MIRVLLVAGALLVIAQLHRAGGGVMAGELNRIFGLGPGEIGLVMGAMLFASALAQIPTGLAFDRFGARRTVSAMALVALLGTILFALWTSLPGLLAGRFLIGAGFAGVVSSVLLLAMHWAPPERFTTVSATTLALASFTGGLGATAPLQLALAGIGWRPTFLAVAVLTLLTLLAVFFLVRDTPAGVAASRGRSEGLRESLAGLRGLLADPDQRRILAMGSCTIAPFMAVGGLWAGPYLQDVHGLGRQEASYILLGMVIALNLGTLGYGPLDRRFATRKGVVAIGALLTASVLSALALWPTLPLPVALLLLHALGLTAPFYVTLAAHCRAFVPVERTGRAITTLNLSALGGAFAAQWLSGLLVALAGRGDGLGSVLGYRLVFAFLALMLLAALAVYRKAPDHPVRSDA